MKVRPLIVGATMPAWSRQAVVITMFATSVSAGLLVPAPPTAADEAVDSYTQLPLSHVNQVLVDDASDQTFVTGGPTGEGIAVAAHDGSPAELLSGTQGATEMAPSTDGRAVYATVDEISEVVAVDTASLSTSRIDTGDLCVRDLAATPGALWLAGARCPYASGWLGMYRLDLSTGSLSRIGGESDTWNDPLLSTIPGSSHFLLAQTGTTGDSVIEMNAQGEEVASVALPFVRELEVFNNGEVGVLSGAGYSEVRRLRLGDLSITSMPPLAGLSEWYLGSLAMGATEMAVWQDRRVAYLDHETGDLDKILAFGPNADDPVAQAELRGTTLYAVTYGGRFYRVEDATAGVRTLTISGPYTVERGEPVHLSGRIYDGGDPIAGQVVTVRDTVGTLVGQATTDSAGDWTLDFTATGEGGVVWVARVPASGDQRAVSADLRSGITDPTPLLEVTTPDRISPDQLIAVSGRLTHHDEPLADRAISLYEACDGDVIGDAHVADTTTAGDGTFTIVRDPGECDFYSYRIVAWGDSDWRYTEVKRKVVLDWRRPSMAVTAVASGPVGSPTEITAKLTDQDQPVAGKPVEVWVNLTKLGTFTTDADGKVEVTYTPTGTGTMAVFALFDGDAVSRQAWSRIYVDVGRLPSTLSLAGPETISEGDEVVLTGAVESDGAADLEGLPVLIERTDRDGVTTRVGEATTGASGAFTLTDPRPRGGRTTYFASFTHSNFEPSTAAATVIGTMDDPVLSLVKDRGFYTAGDVAHIRVDLDTDTPRPVVVRSWLAGSATELWAGDLQGVVELDVEPIHTSRITVRLAETDWSLLRTAEVKVPVRLALTTRAKGGYDTVNGFRLYRPAADPEFVSHIEPPRSAVCLRHQVQKRVSGGWTLVRTSTCVRTDDTGRTRWTLLGDQPLKTAFRVRVVFAGDTLNAATSGPWVKFKFI